MLLIVHQCFLMMLSRKIIARKTTLQTTNNFFKRSEFTLIISITSLQQVHIHNCHRISCNQNSHSLIVRLNPSQWFWVAPLYRVKSKKDFSPNPHLSRSIRMFNPTQRRSSTHHIASERSSPLVRGAGWGGTSDPFTSNRNNGDSCFLN